MCWFYIGLTRFLILYGLWFLLGATVEVKMTRGRANSTRDMIRANSTRDMIRPNAKKTCLGTATTTKVRVWVLLLSVPGLGMDHVGLRTCLEWAEKK